MRGMLESKNAPTAKKTKAKSKNRPFHFMVGSLSFNDFMVKIIPETKAETMPKSKYDKVKRVREVSNSPCFVAIKLISIIAKIMKKISNITEIIK